MLLLLLAKKTPMACVQVVHVRKQMVPLAAVSRSVGIAGVSKQLLFNTTKLTWLGAESAFYLISQNGAEN